MSKKVLCFPTLTSGQVQTPRPVNAVPGDDFIRLDVVDDQYAHMSFNKGAVLIAQVGKIVEGHLNYVELNGYGFLTRIGESSPLKIQLLPVTNDTPAGEFQRSELSLIAAIVELYPRGLSGARWVLYSAHASDVSRPLYEAVAN